MLSGEDVYYQNKFFNFTFDLNAAEAAQNVTIYANLWGMCMDGVNTTRAPNNWTDARLQAVAAGTGSIDVLEGSVNDMVCMSWDDISDDDRQHVRLSCPGRNLSLRDCDMWA